MPAWLHERMAKLGRVISEAIVLHYGRDELLARLSHPFWFQSFGAVMGMDWHSSGITTSVLGALKKGLPRELGLHVCGGRGRQSRNTPAELTALSERLGLDGAGLVRASRLTAKVDSAAVQDGFQIYLHGFIVADDGKWVVVQQGMKPEAKAARRYHWHSAAVTDFVDAPHSGIDGEPQGTIVNLTDRAAAQSRSVQVELLATEGPDRIVRELKPQLTLPFHHDVRADDVVLRRLHGALAAAAEAGPKDFPELLLVPGVGARTVFALAQVAEVVHGAPFRFSDPARFSMAHGGKDGHPFPVPLKVYDRTLGVLRDAIHKAKLGNTERTEALKRLALQAQALERAAKGPTLDGYVAEENRRSHEYGGRTVMGDAVPPADEQTRVMR